MGAYIVKRLAGRHYEEDLPHRQWQGKKKGILACTPELDGFTESYLVQRNSKVARINLNYQGLQRLADIPLPIVRTQ